MSLPLGKKRAKSPGSLFGVAPGTYPPKPRARLSGILSNALPRVFMKFIPAKPGWPSALFCSLAAPSTSRKNNAWCTAPLAVGRTSIALIHFSVGSPTGNTNDRYKSGPSAGISNARSICTIKSGVPRLQPSGKSGAFGVFDLSPSGHPAAIQALNCSFS